MGYQVPFHGTFGDGYSLEEASREMTPSLSEFKECMDSALNYVL